jgi:diadenosine tetraphosphate (Ap4A) HIT family hydrolase
VLSTSFFENEAAAQADCLGSQRADLRRMTAIHRMVEACRAGTNPAVVARLSSGWAVMADRQVLTGYCVLLADPPVGHLNELTFAGRNQFLADMSCLGEAVLRATAAVRINYAIFGNLEPALHAHVHPRYADEPAAQRVSNPWSYDWARAPSFDPRAHAALLASIRHHLLLEGPGARTP